MSLFDILEGRMQQIFEGGSSMAPLPFKKLAKQAVREMKRSAVKMDGRTFAPSLYTVLVNPADDAVIAPLYQQVTDELVDFVAHEAQNEGLALMANPMVRFIADPNIKQGKMEIVAEVVTPEVVEALRVEEATYARNHARLGTGRGARPMAQPMAGPRPVPQPAAPQRPPAGQRPAPAGPRPAPQRPAPAQPAGAGPAPVAPAAPAGAPAPQAERPRQAPTQPPQAPAPRQDAPAPQRAARPAGSSSCELVDTSSGRTWRIGVPSTVIGRDESSADLVLNDTNVSRRHAELKRGDDGRWHIADLGSTNGTRVNGMRVTEYDLASGDTVTMGLVTLEFREL